MIDIQCYSQDAIEKYKLREQVAGKRGHYTWSYHSTLGEINDPTAQDLLDIAKAVFLADRAFHRPHRLGSQKRRISICVPVRSVRTWSAAAKILERIAGFVSADDWRITFTRANNQQLTLPLRKKPTDSKSVVALFSGGLDSLCGAAYLYSNGVNPIFVTHSPPGGGRVRQLLHEVAGHLGRSDLAEETQLVSFRLAPIERNQAGIRTMFQEPTRRTRPFFFLSLAGAVAIDRRVQQIQMSENGALAINLPIRADAYGARCARQAHAEALRQFQLLLQTVCPWAKDLRVKNPFEDMTKGEAAKLLGAASPLARKSVSCEYVGKQAATVRGWLRRRVSPKPRIGAGPECGLCIPCIVRRAALLRAGIKDADSWYFFNARIVISGLTDRKMWRDVPLINFVSPHVLFMQGFCYRLSKMSFREFVVQYLPELRLASGDLQQFAEDCERMYRLEQRFAREILSFLGGR